MTLVGGKVYIFGGQVGGLRDSCRAPEAAGQLRQGTKRLGSSNSNVAVWLAQQAPRLSCMTGAHTCMAALMRCRPSPPRPPARPGASVRGHS